MKRFAGGDMGYCLRVNQKQISTSSSPDRNHQFEYLSEPRYRFQRRHLPIVSADSKQSALLFLPRGQTWQPAKEVDVSAVTLIRNPCHSRHLPVAVTECLCQTGFVLCRVETEAVSL